MASDRWNALTREYKKDNEKALRKYDNLKNLDLFVLDNSMRESTVGQLRGHTIENKWAVYNEVKKCGFKNVIVASFSHATRVDDVFVQQLVEKGEDKSGMFIFSEITAGIKNKVPNTEKIPVGLQKIKDYGIWNVIFEIDLSDVFYDFEKFTIDQMCGLIKKWITWTHENVHKEAKVLVNLRDIGDTMPANSDRAFTVVEFLAKLPTNLRPFGIIFEEPGGNYLPEECSTWAKYIRKVMKMNDWDAHLLVHIHEKFGLCDATNLQVLMEGANGIWGSVCIEGAAMGHASSTVTLTNLIRLGNTHVTKNYNCQYLRKAAINVTKFTTGKPPHPKQPIYGARALDMVFSLNKEDFDMAEFFDEEPIVRISTLSSPEMIVARLTNLFGEDPQFTVDRAKQMLNVMLDDLKANRKEEYQSKVGLAVLFDRSGGSMTAAMRDSIEEMKVASVHAEHLIEEVKAIWDEWDLRDNGQKDNMLEYDAFYNGFMAPYFSCYRCADTKRAVQALDMDADGQIDWNEFLVYLKWAVHQYPKIEDTDELLDVAFTKGLIPAMRDELIKKKQQGKC